MEGSDGTKVFCFAQAFHTAVDAIKNIVTNATLTDQAISRVSLASTQIHGPHSLCQQPTAGSMRVCGLLFAHMYKDKQFHSAYTHMQSAAALQSLGSKCCVKVACCALGGLPCPSSWYCITQSMNPSCGRKQGPPHAPPCCQRAVRRAPSVTPAPA